MTLNLVRRSTKNAPLTAADHDGNLDKLEGAIEGIELTPGPAGPAGPAGPQGPAGADGAGLALQGTVSTVGDLPGSSTVGYGYIVEATGDLHVWNGTGWVNAGPIQGPAGPAGPAGPTGATGPAGPTGPQGPAGADGSPGADGADGAPGSDGASAYQLAVAGGFVGSESDWLASLVGPQGPTGPQGPAGADGADGAPGADGADGAPGVGVPAGGTPGQALIKSSGTDYDADWSDLPARTTTAAGVLPATSYAAITYAATVNLDLAVLDGQYRTISLTGNLTLTTSNRATGRTAVIRVIADASQRTLTFPADWKFLGTKPANIAASKTGVLSLTFFGTADSDCVAAWGVQG